MIKLKNLMSESDNIRTTDFIWGDMQRPASSISSYEKDHDNRMKSIMKTISIHFSEVSLDNILIFTADTTHEYNKVAAAAKKSGQLGVWTPDKKTFLFVAA